MHVSPCIFVKMTSVNVEQPCVSVLDCAVIFGVDRFVCVPAFVHPPQVNTSEGGATLVSFAGVRWASKGEALYADLGDPISRLAVQGHVATIQTCIPHAACNKTGEKKKRFQWKEKYTVNCTRLQRFKMLLDRSFPHTAFEQICSRYVLPSLSHLSSSLLSPHPFLIPSSVCLCT